MSDVTCVGCGIPLHAGTAKAFTVCDACWDKAYKIDRCEHGTPRGLGCWLCENTELNKVRAELTRITERLKWAEGKLAEATKRAEELLGAYGTDDYLSTDEWYDAVKAFLAERDAKEGE